MNTITESPPSVTSDDAIVSASDVTTEASSDSSDAITVATSSASTDGSVSTSTADDDDKKAASSSSSSAPPPKPQRPYTEYNIFFQLEREYLLQSSPSLPSDNDNDGDEPQGYTPAKIAESSHQIDAPESAALRPLKYKSLVMPADWYVVGHKLKGKRKHRKTHGAVTFVELTKHISRAWATVNKETKIYCGALASMELKRYRTEMKVYIDKYGADAAKGKRRTKVEVLAERAKKEAKSKLAAVINMNTFPSMTHSMSEFVASSVAMEMDDSVSNTDFGSFAPLDFHDPAPSAKRQCRTSPITPSATFDFNDSVGAIVTPESVTRASVENMLQMEEQRRRIRMEESRSRIQQLESLRLMENERLMAMMRRKQREVTVPLNDAMEGQQQQHHCHTYGRMQQQQPQHEEQFEPPFNEEVDAFLNSFETLMDKSQNDLSPCARPSPSSDDDAAAADRRNEEAFTTLYLRRCHRKCSGAVRRIENSAAGRRNQQHVQQQRIRSTPGAAW